MNTTINHSSVSNSIRLLRSCCVSPNLATSSRGWPALSASLLAVAILAPAQTCLAADAETQTAPQPPVNFPQAPAGSQELTIFLAVTESPGDRVPGFLPQRSPRPLEELKPEPPSIASDYTGKEFFAYQIGALPDGARYVVALNEDTSLKFLNRNESALWYARIYKLGNADAKPEVIKQGYQSLGNDVTFPVEMQLPGIGTTRLKSLKTEWGYSLNGTQNGKPSVYSGRGASLQVSGSQVTAEGKLTVTVTVPEEMAVTPETQVSLRFEPVTPGLPERSAAGKLTDYLTLGNARFVVTGLMTNFASVSLALVAGSLEQTLQQQLQLGSHLPAFAQVDLASRKTITQSDVLSKARNSSGVIFILGDLDVAAGRFGPPGFRSPSSAVLPLPPGDVVEQCGLGLDPKPLVILVTRQIGLDFLYSDLRNKTPDYLLLTDYADPLRTIFRPQQANSGPWYNPPYSYGNSQEPTLRQLFNLPVGTLAVVAFDVQGKVRYVKADAAGSFLPSVAEARSALAPRKAAR